MNKENCIEWLTGDDTMTLSLTNKRFISRVKQIIQEKPESGEIIAEKRRRKHLCTFIYTCIAFVLFRAEKR